MLHFIISYKKLQDDQTYEDSASEEHEVPKKSSGIC